MVNTSAKGSGLERSIRDVLEAQGYVVEKAGNRAVWAEGRVTSRPHDFFGCIDIIAVRMDGLKFVQSTVAGKQSAKFDEILAIDWPSFVDVEIWTWYGGRKSKDMKFDGNGKLKVIKAQGWDVWRLNHKLWKFENVDWIGV